MNIFEYIDHYGSDDGFVPAEPECHTTHKAGSTAKMQVMISRLLRGEDLHHKDDYVENVELPSGGEVDTFTCDLTMLLDGKQHKLQRGVHFRNGRAAVAVMRKYLSSHGYALRFKQKNSGRFMYVTAIPAK